MAIAHTTLALNEYINPNSGTPYFTAFKTLYNSILNNYEWNENSEAHIGNNALVSYGKYYFTPNSYIQIQLQSSDNGAIKITLITPNDSKEIVMTPNYAIYTFTIGKTNKGIALQIYSGPNSPARNSKSYNLYIGEITKLDGTVTKGCIYAADDGTLTIATDDGISSEIAQTSTINADRTAILTPVVDTTYGNVFKDIYFMRSSPLNCNIMAVEGQDNFLCGKTLCLKDQEVA